MAVPTVENVGAIQNYNTTATSRTFSYTFPTGITNPCLIVLFWGTSGGEATACTYAGASMTKETAFTVNQFFLTAFSKVSPATGANDVVITHASQQYVGVIAIALGNVDQSDVVDVSNNANSGSATDIDVSVTTTVAETLLIQWTQFNTGAASATHGAGQTERVDSNPAEDSRGSTSVSTEPQTATGTYTQRCTGSSATSVESGVIAVKGAATAAASIIRQLMMTGVGR